MYRIDSIVYVSTILRNCCKVETSATRPPAYKCGVAISFIEVSVNEENVRFGITVGNWYIRFSEFIRKVALLFQKQGSRGKWRARTFLRPRRNEKLPTMYALRPRLNA